MTWAPGDADADPRPAVVRGRLDRTPRRARVFNLYRPPTIEPGDAAEAGRGSITCSKVYPDDAEHIIRWLAHRVQRPADKINHALVLGGSPGHRQGHAA